MKKNKHIAMWACPRSRSSVISLSFEQLAGCIVYDEPFLGPYRWIRKESYHWEEVTETFHQNMEKDYKKVIKKLTGDLPDGYSFSFQKLSTDEYLPEFGTEWILQLNNFFLIRHPKDILLSLKKALDNQTFLKPTITDELVGIKALYDIFQLLKSTTGKTPLVVSSDDVVKNPQRTLQWLCDSLGLEFSENMLSWDKNLQNSVLSSSSEEIDVTSDAWYETLRNSQSFQPYAKNEEDLPQDLIPMLETCMPYYESLLGHCHVFSN